MDGNKKNNVVDRQDNVEEPPSRKPKITHSETMMSINNLINFNYSCISIIRSDLSADRPG